MNKAQKPIATIVALLPLACYVILTGAACYSWAVFGNWPSYGNPDPKNLPVRAVYTLAAVATLVGIVSVLLLPIAEIAFGAGDDFGARNGGRTARESSCSTALVRCSGSSGSCGGVRIPADS